MCSGVNYNQQPYQGPMPVQVQPGMVSAQPTLSGISSQGLSSNAGDAFAPSMTLLIPVAIGSPTGLSQTSTAVLGMGSMGSMGMGGTMMGNMAAGGNMGIMTGTGISSSTYQVWSWIQSALASVLNGLSQFVQMMQLSALKRQQQQQWQQQQSNAGTGTSNADNVTDSASGGTGGSNKGSSAVDWAQSLKGKGPSQVNLNQYHAGAWCADFVSTALEKNGGSPWGHESLARNFWDKSAPGTKRLTKGEAPQKGDIIVWNGHVGMVGSDPVKQSDGSYSFTTIEGNYSNKVGSRKINTKDKNMNSDKQFLGFVRIT